MTDPIRAFEERYAAGSNMTVEQLHQLGRYGEVCDCGEPGCEGYQMGHPWEDAIIEDRIRSDPTAEFDPRDIYYKSWVSSHVFLQRRNLWGVQPSARPVPPENILIAGPGLPVTSPTGLPIPMDMSDFVVRNCQILPSREGGIDELGNEWHRTIPPEEETVVSMVHNTAWMAGGPILYLNCPELGPEYRMYAGLYWNERIKQFFAETPQIGG